MQALGNDALPTRRLLSQEEWESGDLACCFWLLLYIP